MKTVQQLLIACLLAALTALAVCAALWVRTATRVVAQLPDELDRTRAALLDETRATRRDLLARAEREIGAFRRDAGARLSGVRDAADRRVGDTLARADRALDTVDALRADLKPALDHSAAIAAQVNDALPLFLDCDHNADCVFNRYVGASRGVERAALNFGEAAQDVRGALPGMLQTWSQIGAGVSGTAGNLDRLTKPHWYDRLIGYALNGIVIYRNLNPIANVTLRGVQTLSARP